MELVVGKRQESRLWAINRDGLAVADRVQAAVAYVSDDRNPLLRGCLEKRTIRLTLWARYDESVPVSPAVMRLFLSRRSPNFECRLIANVFHPKVIWWHGFGAYVGSANLTDPAWNSNFEAGIFLSAEEIEEQDLRGPLESFFDDINEVSQPLTEEILQQAEALTAPSDPAEQEKQRRKRTFNWIIPKLDGLSSITRRPAIDRKRDGFLTEWMGTLQHLRDIAERVATEQYRPTWVPTDSPAGIQADQFLHAYYYTQIREGVEIPYYDWYHRNKANPEAALVSALDWWKSTTSAPSSEGQVFDNWYPVLSQLLTVDRLPFLTRDEFCQLCARVHAVRDHAKRVRYQTFGLGSKPPAEDIEQRVERLAHWLYEQHSAKGRTVLETIHFVLFGGRRDEIPRRLWDAINLPEWKQPHFGLSALGELVGWAFPDFSPPRNGRTSKCLTALGYKVAIHSE